MIVEGLVTNVHEEMFTFVINQTTTVCSVLLFIKNLNQELPEKGSKVKVVFPSFSKSKESILILYPGCTVESDLTVNCSTNYFAEKVEELNLQPKDLFQLHKNYKYLKQHFQSPNIHNKANYEKIILCIIEMLSKRVKNPKDSETILPDFDLKFISQICHVYLSCEEPDLNYFTFGNHWNWSEKSNQIEYLFGYLYTHEKHGSVYFTDFKRKVPCIVTNTQTDNLMRLMRNYVLIKDYVVLTEIYNGQKPLSLEYLLIDLKKVSVIYISENIGESILRTNFTNDCKIYPKTTTLKILSKSLPMVNIQGRIECWLEVLVEKKRIFMCLPSSYSETFALLQENRDYQVYYTTSLKKKFNKELYALNTSLPQYELEENCIFTPLNSNFATQNIIDEEKAFHQLSVSSGLITFQGKLKEKKFVDPLPSRTKKILLDENFGTPGKKTHLLEFNAGGKILTVYLNNWENMLIPLGLIPNMVLLVRNVVSQKGRYYKSTMFTSFEVVKYEPECRFETVNLCGGVKNDYWGSPYFLGAGKCLPAGVIIWSSIAFIEILNLKVYYQCIKCSSQVFYNKRCLKCNENGQELTAHITIITCDEMGESKVIAKDKHGMLLLQLFMGTQDKIFKKWCEGFTILNNFEYSGETMKEEKGESSRAMSTQVLNHSELEESVRKTLKRHFDIINEHGLNLDLKCKKMFNEISEGFPIFFLLDVRHT